MKKSIELEKQIVRTDMHNLFWEKLKKIKEDITRGKMESWEKVLDEAIEKARQDYITARMQRDSLRE